MGRLKDKVVLITGGSRGLGKALVDSFIKEEAQVITFSRNGEETPPTHYKCDITRQYSVDCIISYILRDFGKIDVLINNAGTAGVRGDFDKVNLGEWTEAINVNLIGSARMIHAVLPTMKKRRSGKIIQISGGGVTSPFPYMSSYAASKAGIVHLAETIAKEVEPYNIDINCVAPGLLDTQMVRDSYNDKDNISPEYYLKISKCIKNNSFMPMEKAVSLCIFLASNESHGLTGKLISAQWDAWKLLSIPQYKRMVMESDVFSVRRIIGKDRDMRQLDK